MVDESDNKPILFEAEDRGFAMALLDCGHHALVSKGAPVWENPAILLLCDHCSGEHLLHPLVLLEFEDWNATKEE